MSEPTADDSAYRETKRLHSAHSSGMDSSTLRFKNVNFIVEKPKSLFGGEKEVKNILTDVSGTVKWGRKCAELRSILCARGADLTSSSRSIRCPRDHGS